MQCKSSIIIAILGVFVLSCVVSAACWSDTPRPSKIRVLFEVGGPYHDNPVLYNGMKKTLEDTGSYTVNVTKDRDQFKAANMKNYDLVIDYTTSGDLTKDQEQGLIDFVKNGGGFVGIHSATDSYHNSDAYWKMIGGKFVTHSNKKFKVNITGKSHVIVRGMHDFEIQDETYVDKFHPESKIIVLVRRDYDSEPAAWIQYYDSGRVFATGLGHGESAWNNPSFREMIIRATLWATKRLNP